MTRSAIWLSADALAALCDISIQAARKVVRNAALGQAWRGTKLDIRALEGTRGGRSGVRYEVALSSLPAELQERFSGPLALIEAPFNPPAPRASSQLQRQDYQWRVIEDAVAYPARSKERRAEVERAAAKWGEPVRTIYRWIADLEAAGGDIAALGRKRPANAGQRRVHVSRPFDTAYIAAGYPVAKLAELGEHVAHLIKRGWASPAQRAGWKAVRREVLTTLRRDLAERGISLPAKAFHLSQRRIADAQHYRIVDIRAHDRKRYDDMKPRIRRNNALLQPMQQIVMDVKPLDCIVQRPDGSTTWPKMIGFMDTGTHRLFRYFVMLAPGEGVRQEHVAEAFIAMVMHPEWGFVTARNYGIDPFTGAMQTLGDAASAMNRSLGDAVEALADARTGEFERLKGFGITASVRGAAVTFSYVDKAGKEASKSVGKSALKIDRAVRDILDIKFGGGMERQALTLIGIWNNLQDVVTNFQLSVASRGFFERVKNSLDRVLKWTDKLAGDGTFDLWATRISDQLTALWDASERFIRDTDWQGVATGMEAIVGVIARIVRGIGNASVAWTVFSNSVARQSAEATLKRGPSVWESMFGGYADRARAANQTLADLEARRVGAGRPQVRRLPGGGVIWPEGATRRELRGNGTSRGGPSRAPGAMVPPAPKREKASLEIILKGDGSKQASVGRISAPDDTRITVTRGRAMGRAA